MKSSGLCATSFRDSPVVFLTATVSTLNGFPDSGSGRIESLSPWAERVQFLNCFGRLAALSKALRKEAATSEFFSESGCALTTELLSAEEPRLLSSACFALLSLGGDD